MLSPDSTTTLLIPRTFSFFYELLTIVGREHDDSCARSSRCDFPAYFQAVHARHR